MLFHRINYNSASWLTLFSGSYRNNRTSFLKETLPLVSTWVLSFHSVCVGLLNEGGSWSTSTNVQRAGKACKHRSIGDVRIHLLLWMVKNSYSLIYCFYNRGQDYKTWAIQSLKYVRSVHTILLLPGKQLCKTTEIKKNIDSPVNRIKHFSALCAVKESKALGRWLVFRALCARETGHSK